MITTLLKCTILVSFALLQYGIVLLNLDKIHIFKQLVNIDITSGNGNTNKVEEVGSPNIREDQHVVNRNDHGFPII